MTRQLAHLVGWHTEACWNRWVHPGCVPAIGQPYRLIERGLFAGWYTTRSKGGHT